MSKRFTVVNNMKEFEEKLKCAIKWRMGISVLISMPDLPDYEVIQNPFDNVLGKLKYYKKAYDEQLKLKTFDKIKIVGVRLDE